MSSCCSQIVYLKKPDMEQIEADGNVSLELATLLWADKAKTIPFDLTGYTARGAIGNRTQNVITPLLTLSTDIVMTDDETVVYAIATKSQIETLSATWANKGLYYDVSLDNASEAFSFSILKGTIIFNPGVSS
jgi:hypothetical protein